MRRRPERGSRYAPGAGPVVPDDGLTTRAGATPPCWPHTGEGKGKSTAAFGMALRAWNAGMSVAVFQFVKSAKWKVGEEAAFAGLGRLHDEHGIGGAVEWHKMGAGGRGRAPRDVRPRVESPAPMTIMGPPRPRGGTRSRADSREQRHEFYVPTSSPTR